jgi:hypothetical protein
MRAIRKSLSFAVTSAAILLLPTSPSLAQEYSRDMCLAMAQRCVANYASWGYETPNQCWDDRYAEQCPDSGGAYDPTGHDYTQYNGEGQYCYGNCGPGGTGTRIR